MLGLLRLFRYTYDTDVFGTKIGYYRRMGIIGLFIAIAGIPVTMIGYSLNGGEDNFEMWPMMAMVLGISAVFMGFVVAFTGLWGFIVEKKKAGMQRITTIPGRIAFVIGIISFASMKAPILPIIIGAIAILVGIISIRQGDNEWGPSGIAAAVIGIVGNVILMILFWGVMGYWP